MVRSTLENADESFAMALRDRDVASLSIAAVAVMDGYLETKALECGGH